MRSRQRQLIVLTIIGILLLVVLGLYIIPSPLSTAMHDWVWKIRAVIASYDRGASMPVTPKQVRTSPVDGMVQMLVPAGEFVMGTNETGLQKNRPAHKVNLSSFWMDQVEVTNGMYEMCVEAGKCPPPTPMHNPYYGHARYKNYPVVYVIWRGANTYCKWAGRRLPTEAEWEKAARGTEKLIYPWGNAMPDPTLANFNLNVGAILDVTRYPLGASPYGVLNMAGNVREWVADWFHEFYYIVSPGEDPVGPRSGTQKSLRGGSYDDSYTQIRTYNRFSHAPTSPGINRGFRCASDADE